MAWHLKNIILVLLPRIRKPIQPLLQACSVLQIGLQYLPGRQQGVDFRKLGSSLIGYR